MHQQLVAVAEALLDALAAQRPSQRLLHDVLERCSQQWSLRFAAVLSFERGEFQKLADVGEPAKLPYELFSDALDAEQTLSRESWIAAPLPRRSGPAQLLTFNRTAASDDTLAAAAAHAACWIAAALRTSSALDAQHRRLARLQATLEILAQWGQTLETDRLLEQIAEASTRLLSAERASVFLWDRQTKTLVGRPALGVEEGELRVPENTGIVGQVIASGQPRRVDLEEGQQEIDRSVDEQLGYQTRTLLCVPLRGREGKLFGAFELINKRSGNFTDEDETALIELAAHAAVALENTQQYEQLLKTRNQLADDAAAGVQLVGQSPPMQALRSTIARVADTELAVLILGENGTGKEVVARSIHYLSHRRHEPFIAVNCAALTETLLESELFGHEKGAFTDARETRVGKFELAAGGTLFLDEIGDMSPGGQAKLLRVLEEKLVVRVGGSTPIHTNARVVAATNQNLTELVGQKKFRQDLYFRLNVVTLELPPLRERGDDILLLAEQFLATFSRQARRRAPRLTAAARKRLLNHNWPGNVRELRNLMERIAHLSSGDKVDADELAFILAPKQEESGWLPDDMTLSEATREFQAHYIEKQIERSQGNMTTAAERLGLHRANLYRKMRQLDVEPQ
jgi:Nif-specific regulatory protein